MHHIKTHSSDMAFTAALKAEFEAQTGVLLAIANRDRQPFVQHCGGLARFVKVLDAQTIVVAEFAAFADFADFADFTGNRPSITQGNLQGPQRFDATNVEAVMQVRELRLAALEAALRQAGVDPSRDLPTAWVRSFERARAFRVDLDARDVERHRLDLEAATGAC